MDTRSKSEVSTKSFKDTIIAPLPRFVLGYTLGSKNFCEVTSIGTTSHLYIKDAEVTSSVKMSDPIIPAGLYLTEEVLELTAVPVKGSSAPTSVQPTSVSLPKMKVIQSSQTYLLLKRNFELMLVLQKGLYYHLVGKMLW